VALGGLLLLVSGDLRLGTYAIGGFAGALGIFWLLARLSVRTAAGLRRGGSFGWRQGLANLERHAAASTLQIVALALGLMAMLLLGVTRGELLDVWQRATPVDAPNRFVINIQPDQRQAAADLLGAGGIKAELAPMVRGRLMKIDGEPVSAESYPDDERARRLIEREFNLSWRADAPPGNRISAGRWFAPDDAGKGLASVEEGLAKTLGIKLGDELLFVIAGQETKVRVSSLRKLDWDSMRVNFFVLTPPGVLDSAPVSYITSFHLDESQSAVGQELVSRFPNLTLIDVGAILAQIQAIMGQVSLAVQFIFLFTLLAGAVVLVSALLTAFDERRFELAVMRALGAGRSQLRQALLAELAVVGAISGLIAAGGASFLGQLLARNVFQLDMPLNLWLFPLASAAGAMLAVGIGWLAVRQLLNTPPLLAMRAGA
ncbi:MAG: FtsX-like permease family protein, partial [Azonexus sp.]